MRKTANGDMSAAPPLSPQAPNPEILKKDPMAELFGPGSTIRFLGEPDDEMPEEVRGVIDQFGLAKKAFQCRLKEVPDGVDGDSDGTEEAVYIKSWNRGVPSLEYIGKNYGPGRYILEFLWRATSDDPDRPGARQHRHMREAIPFQISQKSFDDFKKHKLEEKIRLASEVSTKVRDTLVEKSIEGQMLKALNIDEKPKEENPAETARQYIEKTIETAKMIGLNPVAAQPPARTIEWDKVLPAVLTAGAAFLKVMQDAAHAREDQFNRMLMLLLTQNQNSSQQMFELMKVQSGQGSGNLAIKEFKDMVLGALDIKEALSGTQKEGLADRIFRVVEGIAPQILSIAQTAASASAARIGVKPDPMVGVAKAYIATNPDFRALKNNPEEMKAFIEKMDGFFGWEQADIILQVAGWERPEDCPRDPEKKKPPIMTQTAEEAEAETEEEPGTPEDA